MEVAAYIRLSREDLSQPGNTEDKLKARRQICLDLAKQAGLHLDPANIKQDLGTGTKLSTRPSLLELLQQARAGQLPFLITPYQDRLTRGGDHDRGTIKEALCAGNVTVITTEGTMRFDREFGDRDELMFDIKAAVASHYVRDVIKKRREADLVNLRTKNKQSRGTAPYGYHRVTRPDVLAGRYQAEQLGTVIVIEHEYTILQEIFRRLDLGESAGSIAEDLTARGVASPGVSRPGVGSQRWYASSLYAMIRNPFYVGRNSQRQRVERGRGKRRLSPDEYIISEVQGDWPQPIDDETHYRLLTTIRSQEYPAQRRTGLLTGRIYCPQGRPMRVDGSGQYGCDCRQRGEKHPGCFVSGERIHRWMVQILSAILEVLPDTPIPSGPRGDRAAQQRELTQLRQNLSQKQQQVSDLMLREAYFVSLMSRTVYEETARKTAAEIESLRSRVDALEIIVATPEPSETWTLLAKFQQLGGANAFFERAPDHLQRTVVENIIERIDIDPPPVRYVRTARVTLWPAIAELQPNLPPIPKAQNGSGPSNLIHTPEAQKRRIEARWEGKRKADRQSKEDNGEDTAKVE